ncbi:MAG: hypothetical protein GY853_02190 [PVC group bacterium]|nr:hypothetical protein [PVC group bacterium]
MRDTSLRAYSELSPELPERQLRIYEMIKRVPLLTAYEIAGNLGKRDPNYVRPRITELTKSGFIRSYNKRKCRITGKTVYTWGVV